MPVRDSVTVSAVISRSSLRVGAVTVLTAGLTAVLLGAASPAFANIRDDGEQTGGALPAAMTVLLYVVAPILLFLIIAALVLLPSRRRGPRYRPGLGWWASPMWFAGPPGDPEVAIGAAVPTVDGGGASARW